MAAVNLIMSKTFADSDAGTPATDALEGGGTGINMGSGINGAWFPIIDKSLNQGQQDVYIAHDGANPITDVAFYIQPYGALTGFTYGGQNSAASDYASINALGLASGTSKNNADGLSGGLWIDNDYDAGDATRFEYTTRGIGQGGDDSVWIVNKVASSEANTLSSALTLKTNSMVKDSGGSVEAAADSPVEGQIGPNGNTALGQASHLLKRFMIPSTQNSGGFVQWDGVFRYLFTA
jgi:hypothetical protein